MAHYDLQLHQKDVKTHSSTGICMEKFTWHNSKGFVVEGKERKGCCLKKSIYGLKQASRQTVVLEVWQYNKKVWVLKRM